MNDTPRDLFDFESLRLKRDRAVALGWAEGFLHQAAGASLADRLGDVPRAFQRGVLLGEGPGVLRAELTQALRGAALSGFEPAPGLAVRGIAPITGETLPLAEGQVDLAISAFLLHHLNDPVGHLIQLRRALVPDGLVLVACLGGQTLSELRAAFAEAEAEVTGGLSPRISPMAEIRDLGGLMQRAGFTMPVADSERLTVSYASPLHLMRDLRAMGETSVLTDRPKGGLRREVLARMSAIYHAHFPAEGGRIRASFEIVYLTGWSPGPDQPQPKRPGSATTRLADALGTFELPAGEKAPGKN